MSQTSCSRSKTKAAHEMSFVSGLSVGARGGLTFELSGGSELSCLILLEAIVGSRPLPIDADRDLESNPRSLPRKYPGRALR